MLFAFCRWQTACPVAKGVKWTFCSAVFACLRNKASKKEKGPEMKIWGKRSKKGAKGLQLGTQNEFVGDRWPLARQTLL